MRCTKNRPSRSEQDHIAGGHSIKIAALDEDQISGAYRGVVPPAEHAQAYGTLRVDFPGDS